MLNAVNWQIIIQLSLDEENSDSLYRNIFPTVGKACKELNEKLDTYKVTRHNRIDVAKGYLKSTELAGNNVIVDTIAQDSNGFCSLPEYSVFRTNYLKFHNFIYETYSPTMDYTRYISDIIRFKDSLFKGNTYVNKVSNILTNPDDLGSYFDFLTSSIEIDTLNNLIPNYPILGESDKEKLYPKLIKMVADYLIKKDLLSFFIRLFEVTDSRNIFISSEALETMSSLDIETLYSLEGIVDVPMNYMSLEAAESDIKAEGDESEKDKNAFFKFFEKIKNRIQAIPSQLSTFKKKVEMFFAKRKNIRLYKRVLGKIPGLYKRYGSRTEIDESIMKGDPVQILAGEASEYIIQLGRKTGEISDKLLDMLNKISTATNFDTIKGEIENWIQDSPIRTKEGEESAEVDKISKRMRKATRAKLVEAVLNGNEIYGYTAESMVLKKFPPPNHTIVSLFVENPFERPQMQAVTDIFQSPESFEIMANSDKRKIFAVSELQAAVLRNKITAETFKTIERKRKDAIKRVKIGTGFVDRETEGDNVNKENIKLMKEAMKGVKLSIKEVSQMKIYVMDCINIYFSMMMRIDNLCLACINAMLLTEKRFSDGRYDLGENKAIKGKNRAKNPEDDYEFSSFSEAGRTAKKVQKRQNAFDANNK